MLRLKIATPTTKILVVGVFWAVKFLRKLIFQISSSLIRCDVEQPSYLTSILEPHYE